VLLLAVGETFVIITAASTSRWGSSWASPQWSAPVHAPARAAGLPEASIPLAALICRPSACPRPDRDAGGPPEGAPFLATFGLNGIADGFSEIISKNTPIGGLPPIAGELGNEYFFYIVPGKTVSFLVKPQNLSMEEMRSMISVLPILVVIFFVFVAIFAFVLRRTRFGQHTYAIGGSMDAATRSGINVPNHLTWIYIISAFFASLSGVMYVLKYVSGRADAGSARMLDSVVAVVIGGASMYGGTGTVKGTIIGALIIATLETGMVNLLIPSHNRYIAIGAILVIAVLIDQFFPELVGRGE
jgi:ribose transport system permease protein